MLALAASVTGTLSVHVYRATTVRQDDHGGVPRVGSQSLARKPRRGEKGLPDVTAK